MQRGFDSGQDLKLARELKVRDRDDFHKLTDLKFVQSSAKCSIDESILLVLLSKLPDDKKVSINKLSELFEKGKEEYRFADTGEMPEWFETTLNDRGAVIHFITKNESIKKYGHYYSDGEYFETSKLRERDVVIDGSNVAYNSKGNAESKPYLKNIIILIHELKRIGFTGVTVIVDASLKHRIADADKLKELKELANYMEAPAENPADIFIIQYVKRNHCLLVSNDTFREWKLTDPWSAENIDFYRMSFMITGETVLLPDIKGK
ncbi:MAG: hypothetical protein LH473_00330 [Chitinophagales bacterium]|nr:hypothetical protein [Chitinophagales bacterium]